MKDKTKGVVIGCFGGFWGDSMDHAVGQFLRSKEGDSIDYLVSDYLAEVTMCILAKKKAKPSPGMGEGGFVEDFVTRIWKPFGQTILDKGIRVCVNAGGMNPLGLKKYVEAESKKLSRPPIVAAVLGDDLLGKPVEGLAFSTFGVDGTGTEPNDGGIVQALKEKKKLNSLHVYIGAEGITRALAAGADVVITGRCVDSALILGPLCHEFGWNYNSDFHQLAAGTIAGHVVECGAQCTGGNFTDWELGLQRGVSANKFFANIGFPLIEVQANGDFIVTKPTGTGGIVSRLSVAEQLVYEIGDPAAYIVPDVVCDVSNLSLEEVGKNRVLVRGVKGLPPTGWLKATATYNNGYIGILSFVVQGHDAVAKGKAIVASVISRTEKFLVAAGAPKFESVHVEYLGAHSSYFPKEMSRQGEALEVVVRLAVRHVSPKPIMLLASHVPSASTGMCPSLWTIAPGKPVLQEAVAFRTNLLPKKAIDVTVVFGTENNSIQLAKADLLPSIRDRFAPVGEESDAPGSTSATRIPALGQMELVEAPLITIACCRSGDKGDAANVGVIARDPKYFAFLKEQLTVKRVAAHLESWLTEQSTVHRFPIPGFHALNFVLSHVLGGGGLMSLKGDKQGKSIGSILLCMRLKVPKVWVQAYEEGVGAKKAAIRSRL
jgi:hypothetical protein